MIIPESTKVYGNLEIWTEASITSAGVGSFKTIEVGTSGIKFPSDVFGGSGDTAGMRLVNKGGEAQSLEIYTTNDADDWVNLSVPDVNAAKVNGNTIWNAANLTQASFDNWNTAYNKVITSRIAEGVYNANDSLTMAQRNSFGVSFGRIFSSTTATDTPELNHYFSYVLMPETPGANSQTSLAISNTNHSSYVGRGGWNSVMDWDRIWTDYDFSQININNWNTAYSSAHNHGNKSTIDLINQSLATSASPTFAKLNVGIDGISFPDNPFGGGSDTAGVRLVNKGGEAQSLEIYTTNDADDWVNLVVPDINAAKINGNTIWNAANFVPSNYSLSSHYHQYIVGDRTAPNSSAAPSTWYGEGLYMARVYEQDYPSAYGNVLSLDGTGRNQIFTGWSGENGGFSGMWIRNKRDAYDGWSGWQKVLDYETDSISIEHWNDSWARTIQSNIGVNCYQANDGDSWQTRMNARGNHFGRYDNAGNGSPRYLNYNMLRETTSTVYGIFGYSSDGEWYVGKSNYNAEISNYYKIWTTKDITQSNINSWNSPGSVCLPLSGGTMTGAIAMGSVGNNTTSPAINFNGVIQIDGYKTMLADTSNGTGLNIFANGYERETDGGSNSVTIRNERGPLNLGYSEQPVRLSGTTFTANGNTIWTASNLNVTPGHLSGTTSNLQTQIDNINSAMPSTILSTVANTYLTSTGRHLSATIPGNTFNSSIPTQVRVVGNIGVNYVGGTSNIELKLDGNTIFSHSLTAAGDSESDTFEIDFTVRNAGFSSIEVYGLCKMCNTNGATNSAKMRVVSSSFSMTVSNSCIFDIVSTLSGTAAAAITLAKVTRG